MRYTPKYTHIFSYPPSHTLSKSLWICKDFFPMFTIIFWCQMLIWSENKLFIAPHIVTIHIFHCISINDYGLLPQILMGVLHNKHVHHLIFVKKWNSEVHLILYVLKGFQTCTKTNFYILLAIKKYPIVFTGWGHTSCD